MALIIDTGPLYAALDRGDAAHNACRRLLEGTDEVLVIPSPVLVEVDYLASSRGRAREFKVFLDDLVDGLYRVEDLTAEDYSRVAELVQQYEDFPIGFVDAAVFAVVERLREPKLVTLDHRHFGAMRPRHVGSLQLLPEQ